MQTKVGGDPVALSCQLGEDEEGHRFLASDEEAGRQWAVFVVTAGVITPARRKDHPPVLTDLGRPPRGSVWQIEDPCHALVVQPESRTVIPCSASCQHTFAPAFGYSEDAIGEQQAWAECLPLAWRMAADPSGRHIPPTEPLPTADVQEHCAWWTPLLHLTLYGLGWPQPGLGLMNWLEMGRPTEHPILRTINEWWGDRVEGFVAWAARLDDPEPSRITTQFLSAIPDARHSIQRFGHQTSRNEPPWGLHLSRHFAAPLEVTEHGRTRVIAPGAADAHEAVLLTRTYGGWYRSLATSGLGVTPTGRNWRINVVCEPLGWLGQYRRSRKSGLWFSGSHRWHSLGF